MSNYPDYTNFTGSPYCNRPLRTEDEYWRERYELLKQRERTIRENTDSLMGVVRHTATLLYPSHRQGAQWAAFVSDWGSRLDDAYNDTIGAELADAEQKMGGD